MPTSNESIDQLIRRYEGDRARAVQQREAAHAQARALLDAAQAQRRDFTPYEANQMDTIAAQRGEAVRLIEIADDQLRELRAAQADEERIEAGYAQRHATGAQPVRRAYDSVARVGREARTYNPETDRTGKQFLLDVSRGFLFQDPASNDRLTRHHREEQVERGAYLERAGGVVGSGGFAGLVVPQYLTDLYAPATANLRPLANVANRHDLPPAGLSLNISRITGPTAVALQTAENTAVAFQDIDDTLLTVPVQTAAGQQTLSRQAVERGTGVEDVTLDDLLRRYATQVDNTMITQGTTGLSAVAQNTAYTSASPTAAELWPIIFQTQSKLEQALGGMVMPDYVVMHPRRWNWLCSLVGTSWPFIGTASVPAQSGGLQLVTDQGPGVRGILSNGLKVIVDANVPTNTGGTQDEIYVVASREMHLWEDPNAPVFIRAEQAAAASLGVLLVVYGYFAYSFGRYTNNPGKITGTGLAAPAGF